MKRCTLLLLCASAAFGVPPSPPAAGGSVFSLDATTAAPEPSPVPPAAVDPIPTNDPEAVWPRWMPEIFFERINEPTSVPENFLTGTAQDFAVDCGGTVHLAWLLGAQNGNTVVGYSNSRWETRGIDSSGPIFKVRSVSMPVEHVRIAVAPGGDVAVAWAEGDPNDSLYTIFVRRFLASATPPAWEAAAIKVADGNIAGPPENPITTSFHSFSIAFDPLGKLHIAVGKKVQQSTSDGLVVTTSILYSKDFGLLETLDTGTSVNYDPNAVVPIVDGEGSTVVAGDSTGQGHVLWARSDGSLRYRRPGLGTVPVDSVTEGSPPFTFALALDRQDRGHLAYANSSLLKYVRFDAAGPGTVETIPIAGTNPGGPGIDIDAAQEPVVLYGDSNGLGFATKVDNPAVTDPNRWAVQSPAAILASFNSAGFQIDPKVRVGCVAGAVHVFAYGFYTRTIEFNRGSQDSFLMIPVAPNFAADAGNGNLFGSLPLFGARGVGFSGNLSLVYNSLDSDATPISPGWSHNYQMELTWHWLPREANPPFSDIFATRISPISLRLGDGRIVVFRWLPDYDYWVPKEEFGYFARIEIDKPDPGQFLLTTKFGIRYVFSDRGRLVRIEDTQESPNTMTFQYGANDVSNITESLLGVPEATLVGITDSAGRPPVKLEYDAANRLAKVTDPAQATYTLEYDAGGRFLRVRFDAAPAETAWKFEYHDDDDEPEPADAPGVPDSFHRKDLLARIFTPRGFSHSVFYQLDGRVRTVVEPPAGSLGEGSSVATGKIKRVFSYLDTAAGPQEVLVRDRRDIDTQIRHERRRNLALRVTDRLGKFLDRDFDPAFRNLVLFRDKRGFETTYDYYPRAVGQEPYHVADNLENIFRPSGNTPPGVALPPIRYTYTTDGLNRVKSVKDARGALTGYDYSAAGNLEKINYPPTDLAYGPPENAEESFTYDPQGRVKTSKNARGFTTTFNYDDPKTGLVTEILRPGGGGSDKFAYDDLGNTKTHTPAGLGMTKYFLDGLYRVMRVESPSTIAGQQKTRTEYDADSNAVLVWDNLSPQIAKNDYDALGRVVTTTGALGAFLQFSYDREGNTRFARDRRGTWSATYYDALGRVREEVRDGSSTVGNGLLFHRTILDYYPDGLLKKRSVFGSLAQVTEYLYDARANLVETIQPIAAIRDRSEFDENDNLTASRRVEAGGTDLVASETITVYDQRNRVRETKQWLDTASKHVATRYLLDPNGNRTRIIDDEGRISGFAFDARDRQFQTLDHFGTVLSETSYYDSDLQKAVKVLSAATGALLTISKFDYTERGEMKTQEDVFGNVTELKYDVRGRLTERREPGGVIAVTDYTVLDEVEREIRGSGSPDETRTTYGYDANGNRTSITVFNPATGTQSATYQQSYDLANRLELMVYPGVGTSETWRYNGYGNLQSHTDAKGKTVSYEYDPLNRVTAEIHGDPYFKRIEREYDAASNLLVLRQRDGMADTSPEEFRSVTTPDSLGRPVSVGWWVNNAFFKSVSYGYDGSGNRTSLVDPLGVAHTYVWNDDNRLESVERAGGPKVTFEYYAAGQRKAMVLGTAGRVEYFYDWKERLRALKTVAASGEARAYFRYEYDERDNRTRVQLVHLGAVIDYTYDKLNRLQTETWSAANLVASGSVLPSVNVLASVAGGNESGRPPDGTGSSAGPVCVTPGGSGALLSATYTAEYHYDPAGNRTRKIVNGKPTLYTYNARNELTGEQTTEEDPIAYGYDANGNQTSRTQGQGPTAKVESFGYDFANRMNAYTRTVGGTTEAAWLYRYAASGERLAKIDALASPMETEWYMSDGADVCADYAQVGDGPLVPKAAYVQGTSIDSKLARLTLDASGLVTDTNWFAPDALGSVSQILGNDGAMLSMELTTAWGEKLPESTFSFPNATTSRYGYTQRETDSESGLMHFRARSYDPRIGRFVQSDPLVDLRIVSHYRYVGDSPTALVDPLGTQESEAGSVVRTALERTMPLESQAISRSQKRGTMWDDIAELAKLNRVNLDFDHGGTPANLKGAMGVAVVVRAKHPPLRGQYRYIHAWKLPPIPQKVELEERVWTIPADISVTAPATPEGCIDFHYAVDPFTGHITTCVFGRTGRSSVVAEVKTQRRVNTVELHGWISKLQTKQIGPKFLTTMGVIYLDRDAWDWLRRDDQRGLALKAWDSGVVIAPIPNLNYMAIVLAKRVLVAAQEALSKRQK